MSAPWWEVSAPVYDEREDALFTFTTSVQADRVATALVELVKAFDRTRRDSGQKIVRDYAKAHVIHRDHGRDLDGEVMHALLTACEFAQQRSALELRGVTDEQLTDFRKREEWWAELSTRLEDRQAENERPSDDGDAS